MGCFESYMEFREEVEKIKINRKEQVHLSEKQEGALPEIHPPPPDKRSSS